MATLWPHMKMVDNNAETVQIFNTNLPTHTLLTCEIPEYLYDNLAKKTTHAISFFPQDAALAKDMNSRSAGCVRQLLVMGRI